MTWVVLVLVLVPDPAWRFVSIREGGEWGWHSPDVGVAEWGTVVAEQRGGVVVVHCLESSPGELNKMQNSIGGDSVHSYTVSWCPLESAGLPLDFLLLSGCFWWTLTAGLVTFRRTVRSESPSDSPVQQACTGKSPESHRKIAAPPELKIQHSGWVESDGVRLESTRSPPG